MTELDLITPNDTDPDGDTLSISGVSNPINGTVDLNPDGSVTFYPDENYNGLAFFTYTLSDGNGGNDTAKTVSINFSPVNDAPVAVSDTQNFPFLTPENGSRENVNVIGNDIDVDGDVLSIFGTPTAQNGTVTVNPDNSINYYPNTNFTGTDYVTYTINDPSGATDSVTIEFEVFPVSNGTPNAVDDSISTPVNTGVSVPVLNNDSDPESDPLTIVGVTDGTFGTVTLPAGGDPVYTPIIFYQGTDTFTYTISDGQGGTDTATVNVTVGSVPPVVVDLDNDGIEVDGIPYGITFGRGWRWSG